MTRRPAVPAAVLAAVLAAAPVALAAPASAAPAAPAAPAGPYAALGDSFAAGVGAGAAGPRPCARSDTAYPALWARAHPGVRTVQLACSGARTLGVLVHQVPSVPRDARLVTLTAGGNDVGFAPVVAVCTAAGADVACRAAVDVARAVAATVAPAGLDLVVAAVRLRAPHARVVVLGYPHLFGDGPCPAGVPDRARRVAMDGGADLLDDSLARAARLAGATFVDVRGRFAGHGVCSPAGQAWINGPGAGEGSYHPGRAGQTLGYLPALTAVVG